VSVGLEVWTPAKTLRRTLAKGRKGERRIEVAAPILPTFVFARAAALGALAEIEAGDQMIHPRFSLFRHAGRVPLVGDRDVQGLMDEERKAAADLQAIHDAETREAAEQARIAAIKARNARARAARMAAEDRRQELRSERREFEVGGEATVIEAPGFIGRTGIIESTDGRSARIAFGGALTITVEAWQVSPVEVQTKNPVIGIAA
jgi:hypothetical protein